VFWSSRASRWPGRLLIVAAVALVPAVAGCEAGDNAPTLDWHQTTTGTSKVVDGISIANVFVLGAPGNGQLAAGQSAGLFFSLVNEGGADRLLSVQAPGTATAVTIPGGGFIVPKNRPIFLAGPRPRALLTGLTRPLSGGTVITIIMNFQRAGSIPLRVPVIPNSTAYATFSPAPSPSPTPTGTATPGASTTKKSKKHKKSGASTATPTPTA
jgi:copper(I)-binding protein